MKLKNAVRKAKNLLYAIPFTLASILAIDNVKGQNTEFSPAGEIQIFQSKDTTPQATYFNSLKIQSERSELVTQKTLNEDWTDSIPTIDGVFDCKNVSRMYLTHSAAWITKETYYGPGPIFDGYDRKDIGLILQHGGSLADAGMLGFPTVITTLIRTVGNHEANAVVTGDNLQDIASYIFLDAHGDTIYRPELYFDTIMIFTPYTYIGSDGHEYLTMKKIIEFKTENGEATLTYNINNDPTFNWRWHLITTRDTIPPRTEFDVTADSVRLRVIDENYKEGYYTIDNGTPIPLEAITRIALKDLGAPGTTHKIVAVPKDYFFLTGKDSINVTIPEEPIDTIPPIVYLTASKDSVQWNITDTHFKDAWYKILNNTQTIPQTGKLAFKDLGLEDGNYWITFYGRDSTENIGKDSTNFNITHTGLEERINTPITIYPNPATNYIDINTGERNIRKLYTEVYSTDGRKLLMNYDSFEGQDIKRVNIERLMPGTYFMKITAEEYGGRTETFTKAFIKPR